MKAAIYYWLSIIMALLALLLAVSAFLLWVVFPRGYFPDRTLWVEIHKWGGAAITAGVLTHVALHWSWLIRMTRQYAKSLLNVKRLVIANPVKLEYKHNKDHITKKFS